MREWTGIDSDAADAADERVRNYVARREAVESGAPTLTLAELGSLIKATEDELASDPGDAGLRKLLEEMKREFLYRDFLGEVVTRWPSR